VASDFSRRSFGVDPAGGVDVGEEVIRFLVGREQVRTGQVIDGFDQTCILTAPCRSWAAATPRINSSSASS
jgi:hypothetical protein